MCTDVLYSYNGDRVFMFDNNMYACVDDVATLRNGRYYVYAELIPEDIYSTDFFPDEDYRATLYWDAESLTVSGEKTREEIPVDEIYFEPDEVAKHWGRYAVDEY